MKEAYKPQYVYWWEKDFMSDPFVARVMKSRERGAYRCLCINAPACATRPYLPDNDDQLWLLADCDAKDEWLSIKDVVLKKFERVTIKDVALLSHARILRDWKRMVDVNKVRSEAGEASGKSRREKKLQTNKRSTDVEQKRPSAPLGLLKTETETETLTPTEDFDFDFDSTTTTTTTKQESGQIRSVDNQLVSQSAYETATAEESGEQTQSITTNPEADRLAQEFLAFKFKAGEATGSEDSDAAPFSILFRSGEAAEDIRAAMTFAFEVSDYWNKTDKGFLEGTAGFVKAYRAIKTQLQTYERKKATTK